MDLKSNHNSPVLPDPVPMNKSRLGLPSSIVPYSSQATTFSYGLYLTTVRRKPIPGKLDEIRCSGWLDAMQSSSPPRKKLNKDSSFESVLEEIESAYHTWLMKYPYALTSFEQIVNCAKGKKIALFLDYDGTLSPIVDNPDRAFMSSAITCRDYPHPRHLCVRFPFSTTPHEKHCHLNQSPSGIASSGGSQQSIWVPFPQPAAPLSSPQISITSSLSVESHTEQLMSSVLTSKGET